ncbi:MAG: glycosyltransferase [Myxococcota bacterium]
MKLLFALDNYDHGSGGAEMCVRSLAQHLAGRGHRVEVIQQGEGSEPHADGAVVVHDRRLPGSRLFRERHRDTLRWNTAWTPLLDEFVAEARPDLILTQNRLLSSSVAVARSRGIPVGVWVHAYGMVCPTQFRNRDPLRECTGHCSGCFPWYRRLQGDPIRRVLENYRVALQNADLVFSNSRYTRDVLQRLLGVTTKVLYPTLDPDRYVSKGESRDRVLFVKPQYVKGFPIFLEIARRLPQSRFLVAGKPGSRARRAIARLENVECTGWLRDMRPAYARSRVLLGPSIWPEPFGRVFVEAAASGIPSLGSARGGIPEAIGPGGVLVEEIFDVDRWVDALHRLEEPDTWETLSARAREHARSFAPERTVQVLIEAVQSATGLEL